MTSTSPKQDRDFLEKIIGTQVLEDAIEWMKDNLEPSDIFDDKDLISYASGQKPEKVFTQSELEEWAEENGYVKS